MLWWRDVHVPLLLVAVEGWGACLGDGPCKHCWCGS